MEVKYLDNPDKWPVLASRLRAAGEFGTDTETYGQPNKTSPQFRTKIHCWSVAVLTKQDSGKGYRKAVGVVLPAEALSCPDLVEVLEDKTIAKWAHNAPHDIHSFYNHGIKIANCNDSLQWLRVVCPGQRNYGLKPWSIWGLGYGARPTYKELVTYKKTIIQAKRKIEKGCICGTTPCRKRSNTEWLSGSGIYLPHTRVTWRRFTPTAKVVDATYEITQFVPGASLEPFLWGGRSVDRLTAWWEYSLEDSVQGIEGVDWIRNMVNKQQKPRYPWLS